MALRYPPPRTAMFGRVEIAVSGYEQASSREEDTPMDDDHAEDLLRRALVEPGASAAVALRVTGLPVSEDLTVVFHGRRDMGTIQTYVARGRFGAGSQLGADALLRVPCDLDLGDAEDRDEAERMYAEQAGALRDALVGADTVLG